MKMSKTYAVLRYAQWLLPRNETIKVNFGRKILRQQKRKIIDCTNTCVWLIEPFYSLLWFFLILHVQNTDLDKNMHEYCTF